MKVGRNPCLRILYYMKRIFTFLAVMEPILLFGEYSMITGFKGNVCRGAYERSYRFQFYDTCQLNNVEYTKCKRTIGYMLPNYDYMEDLGDLYYKIVQVKLVFYFIWVVMAKIQQRRMS